MGNAVFGDNGMDRYAAVSTVSLHLIHNEMPDYHRMGEVLCLVADGMDGITRKKHYGQD